MLDAIADKVLVNCILVILAATGFIHPIIPVIIIFRDTVVDSIKMIAGNKGHVVAAIKCGKWKTACMMLGITLTLFYNLPFETWNIQVSDILLIKSVEKKVRKQMFVFAIDKQFKLLYNGNVKGGISWQKWQMIKH